MNQKGQVVLILILVMTVALGIGVSIVQKSLVDISTASKVEQSSRAFSAAEAGVEKALSNDTALKDFSDTASRITEIDDRGQRPAVAVSSNRQEPIEYPPLAKEDIVQVWLADPRAALPTCTPPGDVCYNPPDHKLDVYWGDKDASFENRAALELTLVYFEAGSYKSRKWYLDQRVRDPDNNFERVDLCPGNFPPSGGRTVFQCKKTLENLPAGLMLLRARLLYNTTSQPLAVAASGTCGAACSLPAQSREITSTGVSGETQRKVRLFQINKVVPPFFDYAIFSAGEINK